MDKPSAKVICHSRAPSGEELITLEIELHRFILPEFNTHRVFSRNFQSSRAVPVEKMIEQVRNEPAMPVHWGKNQRGMVAEVENNQKVSFYDFIEWRDNPSDQPLYELENYKVSPEYFWEYAAQNAADNAECLHKAGYHKQIVNRLLEPFMWTKGVVTATRDGFDSFFKLRCHKDAQPEIKLLAERMRDAIKESTPTLLDYGEYHLPYVQDPSVKWYSNEKYDIEDAVKVSTSCCAQVSYRVLDDSLDKAKKIYNMLNLPVEGVYPEDPPHYSPTEHIAKVVESSFLEVGSSGYGLSSTTNYVDVAGNFRAGEFYQYRKALEMGKEQGFING